MKTRKTIAPGLLALTLGAAALPAWAGDDCDVPLQRWQSREAVRRMAVEKGWELQRLKIDDGCYEVRGRDAEGRVLSRFTGCNAVPAFYEELAESGVQLDLSLFSEPGDGGGA